MAATTFFLTENNDKIKDANDLMWEQFHETCTEKKSCPIEMDDIFTTTRLDFDKLADSKEYNEVRKACESIGTDEFPTTLCTANSELLLYNSQDDTNGEAVDDFFIGNEPICFPYQCGTKQIELFHTSPLGCDPDTMTCMVYNLGEATCGTRPDNAGVGNCVRFARELEKDEDYTDKMTLLQSAAGLQCIQSKLTKGKNTVCEIESKPVKVTLGQNFRPFEDDPSYSNFVDTCNDMRGATCHMSAMVRMKGRTGYVNMDLTGDYNKYPFCLPYSCSREEMEIITTKRIGDGIVHEINKIVQNHARRKLLPELELNWTVNEFPMRRLQQDLEDEEDDYECPIAELDVCDFLVSDFYCEGFDVALESTLGTSSSTSLTSGSFVAAIAVAGGLLI